MRLEDQVVSLELSKRLKGLGVKQESLFYWVISMTTNYHISRYDGVLPESLKDRNDCYSAFTVAELGEMLPKEIIVDDSVQRFSYWKNASNNEWAIALDSEHRREICCVGTEADCRAKMLIYLKENNLC